MAVSVADRPTALAKANSACCPVVTMDSFYLAIVHHRPREVDRLGRLMLDAEFGLGLAVDPVGLLGDALDRYVVELGQLLPGVGRFG
jgi:hypothetical protein